MQEQIFTYPKDSYPQEIYKGKIAMGQFFTKGRSWLQPHIVSFIKNSGCVIAYDPFAGAGDLLSNAHEYGINRTKGLDIDKSLNWETNDSLLHIPHVENAIIITNPPYLSKYSASRKKISGLERYFEASPYDDLYLIALDSILQAQQYAVAIIPETFINSNYSQMRRLNSITVLEENPFKDTEVPVCVACFDGRIKPLDEVAVYKNCEYAASLGGIYKMRPCPDNGICIKFNVLYGWLALRGVDTTNPAEKIRFGLKEDFSYDWEKGIKNTSRLLTVIQIDVKKDQQKNFIEECNKILEDLRAKTGDIILSPFKGNMKNGKRRRRLDYRAARAIMEQAWKKIYGGIEDERQHLLFQ